MDKYLSAIRTAIDAANLANLGLSGALIAYGCTDTIVKVSCDAATVPPVVLKVLIPVAAGLTFTRMALKFVSGFLTVAK